MKMQEKERKFSIIFVSFISQIEIICYSYYFEKTFYLFQEFLSINYEFNNLKISINKQSKQNLPLTFTIQALPPISLIIFILTDYF